MQRASEARERALERNQTHAGTKEQPVEDEQSTSFKERKEKKRR